MKTKINTALIKMQARLCRVSQNKGAAYVDMLIKILIAVVVGALLLGLIVTLINAIWPELTAQIMAMFGGGGGGAPAATTT